MIYEIKAPPIVQSNYQSLLSPDKQAFYWNKLKFGNLKIGDTVFVVNKAGQEVIHAELEATDISTDYRRDEDKTTFSDSGHNYEADGKWDAFVRLKVFQALSTPADWSWTTLGSSENTYLLGPSASSNAARNNIARAKHLLSLPDLAGGAHELLNRCIAHLEYLLNPEGPAARQTHPLQLQPGAANSEFSKILKKYSDENIVFYSTDRGAAYSISEYEPERFQVNRLNANDPVKISLESFQNKIASLAEHGGRLPFDGFASPVALKNAFLQAPALALSPDAKNVADVTNKDARLRLFCEILENLRVGGSSEKPSLYKPAMLACFIEAIESGDLTENKIPFSFIVPRFIEKLKGLGKQPTEDGTAQPFFRLTRDRIWLHAVHDLNDRMEEGNLSSSSARNKVKYALLKDTFWDLLQDPECRRVALETLDRKWLSSASTVNFWWVSQGRSYPEEREAGFIQAPKETPGEHIKFYWKNVTKVKPGDIIFHYKKPSIRAISVASSEPLDAQPGVGVVYPDRVRVRVQTDYHDIAPPIARELIGSGLAALHDSYSPIRHDGQPNQGYLFELSNDAVAIIAEQLELELLPDTIKQALQSLLSSPPPTTMLNSDFLRETSAELRHTSLIYPEKLLQRFVVSLLAKPFVLLTGTSGTGKTQLALKFAQWLVGKGGYELVAVGADWTDNRQVLGHYNPFEKKFVSTRVLDLILRAKDNPKLPFFLILDEMNLSHVERYFADFLSAMESGDPISLHRNGPKVQTVAGISVEEEVSIPNNLFVIGTVNIDETTYMFSPKVLDRANVIEFSLTKKDLVSYMASNGTNLLKPNSAPGERAEAFISFFQTPRNRKTLEAALKGDLKTMQSTITDLFSLLEGSSMEFGFRTPSEFLKYCEIAHDLTETGKWNCDNTCDVQILQKILPKLHGSRRRIEGLLVGLASYCSVGDLEQAEKYTSGKTSPSHFNLDQPSLRFPESFAKLSKMIGVVQRDQFVSFIQ